MNGEKISKFTIGFTPYLTLGLTLQMTSGFGRDSQAEMSQPIMFGFNR
jgi:hypothetical protein